MHEPSRPLTRPPLGKKTSTVLDVLSMNPERDTIHWAKAETTQFHFHTTSEHSMQGEWVESWG